jgi:hypothetical protein
MKGDLYERLRWDPHDPLRKADSLEKTSMLPLKFGKLRDASSTIAIVILSILSFALDCTSAYALTSWDCAGVSKLTNTCDNVGAYFHVCYGWNGELGGMSFVVPPGEVHQTHVQQYSTFIFRCGIIAPFICPAGMGPVPLDHCD